MAQDGGNGNEKHQSVSDETLRNMLRNQTIASRAVDKAQAENRALGIPNWYSINGEIVSDQQIARINKETEQETK